MSFLTCVWKIFYCIIFDSLKRIYVNTCKKHNDKMYAQVSASQLKTRASATPRGFPVSSLHKGLLPHQPRDNHCSAFCVDHPCSSLSEWLPAHMSLSRSVRLPCLRAFSNAVLSHVVSCTSFLSVRLGLVCAHMFQHHLPPDRPDSWIYTVPQRFPVFLMMQKWQF